MSHIRVTTTYSIQGPFGSTEKRSIYCDHNLSSDTITFKDEDGSISKMIFEEWEKGNDLWDAVQRLIDPFENDCGKLKDKVEYYTIPPWEQKHIKCTNTTTPPE